MAILALQVKSCIDKDTNPVYYVSTKQRVNETIIQSYNPHAAPEIYEITADQDI